MPETIEVRLTPDEWSGIRYALTAQANTWEQKAKASFTAEAQDYALSKAKRFLDYQEEIATQTCGPKVDK